MTVSRAQAWKHASSYFTVCFSSATENQTVPQSINMDGGWQAAWETRHFTALEYDTRKEKKEATWDSDFLHCPATIRIIFSFQLKLKQHRLPVTPPPPPPHPFLMGCNSKRSIFKKELFIASSISINEGVFSRARCCCCCNHRHWTVTWEIVEICMLAYLCFTSDVL